MSYSSVQRALVEHDEIQEISIGEFIMKEKMSEDLFYWDKLFWEDILVYCKNVRLRDLAEGRGGGSAGMPT